MEKEDPVLSLKKNLSDNILTKDKIKELNQKSIQK